MLPLFFIFISKANSFMQKGHNPSIQDIYKRRNTQLDQEQWKRAYKSTKLEILRRALTDPLKRVI